MIAIFKKEIRYFFTSAVGYAFMGIFMISNSLFLWVLKGNFNIFDSGFADLLPFFSLSSWLFVFFIPALTMRLISEEKRTGMLPVLLTKPLTPIQIILGKFFAVLILIAFTLLLSLLYPFMLTQLSLQKLDWGVITGAYVALFLLASTFSSVGVWASTISQNQIIGFLVATFLNFCFFFGIDELIALSGTETTLYFGFKNHFDDISRGVIDSRNILYFLLISVFFLYLSVTSVEKLRK